MSAILESVMAGRPLEVPFIDTHGHFGPWPETVIPRAMDGAAILSEMDRYGCDMVWMTASNPGYAGDMGVKNDYVFDLADRYPDRIIPYCVLTANAPDRNVDELKRCLSRGRCVGVKMHRYRQPPYTVKSAFLQPVLEILNERKLVYLNHCFENMADLEWAADRYGEMTFMAGHFSPFYSDAAVRHPNVKDNTCAAMDFRAVEKEVLRLGRSDTMLVGSDFSLFQLGFGVGMIAYADMAEQDKQNILGLNALAILRRIPWFKDVTFRKPFLPLALPV